LTRSNEYRAYLSFTGDFDPEEITGRLNLKPTKAWKIGDAFGAGQTRSFSRWNLESRLDKTIELEEHAKDVVNQLAPISSAVRELRSTYDGRLVLVAYLHDSNPGFFFDEHLLADLAALKLGIDCDLYCLSETETVH
jgi:hypothetical protein